ncbi:MAG: alpha/beta fold hydrolase [Acidobacteriales bacterium]|nr:alpha/beta fold hydrolase [Terriglobales bacterium]
MTEIVKVLVMTVAIAAVMCGMATGQEATPAQLQARARALLQLLVDGDFTSAENSFDSTMRTALPKAQLRLAWQQLTTEAGPYQRELAIETSPTGGYEVVVITCRFEKQTIAAKIVYNAQSQVSGLFFSPAEAAAPKEPAQESVPEYIHPAAFEEKDVVVGAAPWALPATLSMPKGKGPFPAVVLVHGSGPNDRDETIGPNKVFRDLAWGLASQGVAVLRYEKRTREHRDQLKDLKNFTVEQEVLEDARAAVKELRDTQGIAKDRVFVLGHSEGGYLAPRLAASDPDIAGIIMMAGLARTIEDAIISQTQYLAAQGGAGDEAQKQQLHAIQAEAEKIRNVKPGETGTIFHAPASYWIDLKNYDPVVTAEKLRMPILILQGERDYQVTMKDDFTRWKTGLNSHSNVTFKSYPGLNHLFMSGEGPSLPAEYARPNHVSSDVVQDIAHWVQQQNAR